MRLLNIKTCKLEAFEEGPKLRAALEKCAIISHRWGNDEDELSFEKYEKRMKCSDYKDHQFDNPGNTPAISEGKSAGFLKTARSRLKAQNQEPTQPQFDLEYIWMDTCCINNKEDGEREKAIVLMFNWYSSAKVCYAYLPDVSAVQDEFQAEEKNEKTKEVTKPRIGSFESTDWFTRGWTLQELLAPKELCFFDRSWRFLGTKKTLSAEIQRVTGIEARYLQGLHRRQNELAGPQTNGENRGHGVLHVRPLWNRYLHPLRRRRRSIPSPRARADHPETAR